MSEIVPSSVDGLTVTVVRVMEPEEREKRVDVKGDCSPEIVKEKSIRLNVTDAPLTMKREVNWLSILETDFICIPSDSFG